MLEVFGCVLSIIIRFVTCVILIKWGYDRGYSKGYAKAKTVDDINEHRID